MKSDAKMVYMSETIKNMAYIEMERTLDTQMPTMFMHLGTPKMRNEMKRE